jgi:hypothetical protein
MPQIGGMPSLKTITRMVFAKFQYHSKEREAQNSWDRLSIRFLLHRRNTHNSLNEKESYSHCLAEPPQ